MLSLSLQGKCLSFLGVLSPQHGVFQQLKKPGLFATKLRPSLVCERDLVYVIANSKSTSSLKCFWNVPTSLSLSLSLSLSIYLLLSLLLWSISLGASLSLSLSLPLTLSLYLYLSIYLSPSPPLPKSLCFKNWLCAGLWHSLFPNLDLFVVSFDKILSSLITYPLVSVF